VLVANPVRITFAEHVTSGAVVAVDAKGSIHHAVRQIGRQYQMGVQNRAYHA
jgi:hypothetical protein